MKIEEKHKSDASFVNLCLDTLIKRLLSKLVLLKQYYYLTLKTSLNELVIW